MSQNVELGIVLDKVRSVSKQLFKWYAEIYRNSISKRVFRVDAYTEKQRRRKK